MSSTSAMFAIVSGSSGTGKNTYLDKLIVELTRQEQRVVTVKHACHADLDISGKDFLRHREAGAIATAVISRDNYAIYTSANHELEPRNLLSFLPSADVVLLEGFEQITSKKIEIVTGDRDQELVTPPEQLIAVVSDNPKIAWELPAHVRLVPLDDASQLADWIVEISAQEMHRDSSGCPLTHFDESGRARMVDVSEKAITHREAIAEAQVHMKSSTLALVRAGNMKKGDVLAAAQTAAIMAVKETPRLIPMCHLLQVSGVTVGFSFDEVASKILIEVRVRTLDRTGVEMEALTGSSVAALTIYDMCKAVDRDMEIGRIRLLEKSGGRSGCYKRED